MGKGGGKGGVASFRYLIETVYQDVFAYSTEKVVKTTDWRLGVMKRTFNAGVGVYMLFFMVLYHGYMLKELPTVSVTTVNDDIILQDTLDNLTRYNVVPEYCYTYNSNYTWSANRIYTNYECASFYTGPELTEAVHMGAWLYTSWAQTVYQRPAACLEVIAGNASAIADCPANPVQLSNASIIPVAAEYMTVTITGTYTTSWGRTRSSMNTTISPATTGGINITWLGENETLVFPPGTPVQVTFKQLLDLSGIDLDAYNELNDGGLGPPWPTYRVTGIEIVASMIYQNYVEDLFPFPDPFNFNDALSITVFPASIGTFRSPNPKLWYTGLSTLMPETSWMVRAPQGVLVSFTAAGSIATPSFNAIVSTLLGAMVLFGAATNLIDTLAALIIDGFKEQKFEDELEQRVRDYVRSFLEDVPVRAEIGEFEQRRMEEQLHTEAMEADKAEKELKAAERAARAAERKERGEAAAAEAAAAEAEEDEEEEEAEDRPFEISGYNPSVEPRVLRLIVAGDPHHGLVLAAQGFLENCRCVRFQWSRSRDGLHFYVIRGATLPTFLPTADDVGYQLRAEATPVTDDGYEGKTVMEKTPPLTTRPSVLAKIRAVGDKGDSGYIELDDGITISGVKATLRIEAKEIFCRTKTGLDLGSMKFDGIVATLDRDDHYMMRLEDTEKLFFEISFKSPDERDVYAIIVRDLAGDSIELRNRPEFMAGYGVPPEEPSEDDEGEDLGEE